MLVPGIAMAALLAGALTALSGSDLYTVYGLPDPGAVVRFGLPAVRVLTECGAVLTIGPLLFAAFFVPPQASGRVSAGGFAALRMAMWGSVVWFLGAGLSVPFTIADALGRPLDQVLRRDTLRLMFQIDQSSAWVITALIALVLCCACRVVLSWNSAVALFVLAVVGVMPEALTGHSSSGGAHDVATDSLLFHLIGACLWVGGLIALVAYAVRRGKYLPLATRRFSRLALVCWLVMAVSGVVNALVRLPVRDLLTTTYGALATAKICALLVLGVVGYLHRRSTVPKVTSTGSGGALLRLGMAEILIMLATIGLAAALGRTAPPDDAVSQPGTVEVLIGYPLAGPPTLLRLLVDWRFDLVYGTGALVFAALYLAGVWRLRRRGDRWPIGRTISWLGGCLMILLATSSGIGRYAPAVFSVHMSSHMMLSMMAPVFLVLGGPVTLALRALPAAGKGEPTGPREWLLSLVGSPVSRLLTHPIVALTLFVGSFYGLYFSGLFDAALQTHWGHLAMNAHFLLSGYIFYWPVIGIDPAPRRLPSLGKLGLVFASMPFHAFFGIALMMSQQVIGWNFYQGLKLPWLTDLLGDQHLGGGIAWVSGEIPLIVVILALLMQWSRADERSAKQADRKAALDGDADLAAYNAMLHKLADGPPQPR